MAKVMQATGEPWPGWRMYPDNVLGHCPRCGAPILAHEGAWHGVTPPPIQRTCACFPEADLIMTTTKTNGAE